MPIPQGTYLRVQGRTRTELHAAKGKRNFVGSRQADLASFYRSVDRTSEADLDGWHRSMAVLASDISRNEALSKDDKVRRKVSEVLKEVRKILERASDLKQLEGRLQVPAHAVVRGPSVLESSGAELVLVIALCQVLEVLVRLRGRNNRG